MTTDGADRRLELEARATEAFSFLIARGGSFAQESDSEVSRLRFVFHPLFVEVELDWREHAIFVLVGELVDGRVPGGYYVDGDGRRVRWHLGAVLAQGGRSREAARLRSVTKASGRQAVVDQIAAFADELDASLADLPALIQSLEYG